MPWNNVPEALWPKMESCVNKLKDDGHSEDSATAICYTSVVEGKTIADAWMGWLLAEIKAGRRHSSGDMKDIQMVHDIACKQGAECSMDNVPRMIPGKADDNLVYMGDEIKALGDGKIGGYLIRYGNEEEPDLSSKRDWFHADTYFGAHDGDGVDTTVHHGIPLSDKLKEYADRLLAPVKTHRDKIGLFAETICNMADEYERMVYDLAQKGKFRWSSGAVSHLVKRTPMPNGTNRVDRWIIGEAALTPGAAEPRLGRVLPLKAFLEEMGNSPDGDSLPEPEGSTSQSADGLPADLAEFADARKLIHLTVQKASHHNA